LKCHIFKSYLQIEVAIFSVKISEGKIIIILKINYFFTVFRSKEAGQNAVGADRAKITYII